MGRFWLCFFFVRDFVSIGMCGGCDWWFFVLNFKVGIGGLSVLSVLFVCLGELER